MKTRARKQYKWAPFRCTNPTRQQGNPLADASGWCRTTRGALALVAAPALILGLAGCSESLSEVKGKVHNNGQTLAVKESASGAGGRVMVLFHPQDESKKDDGPHGAIVKSDGTFSVPGATGRGLPPGKYRVEVKWQDPFPMGKDKLEGKFGPENSPVVVDIPSPKDIDINVSSRPEK